MKTLFHKHLSLLALFLSLSLLLPQVNASADGAKPDAKKIAQLCTDYLKAATKVERIHIHGAIAFEEAVPAQANSLAARQPELVKKVLDAIEKYANDLDEKTREGSFKFKLEAVRAHRQEVADLLTSFINDPAFKKEPKLLDLIKHATGHIRLDAKSLRKLEKTIGEHASEAFEPKNADQISLIKGYKEVFYGELGELVVATRVSNLDSHSVMVSSIINATQISKIREALKAKGLAPEKIEREISRLKDIEMDLEFTNIDGKKVWAEIKNFRTPVGPRDGKWDKVIEQAEDRLALQRYGIIPKDATIEFYFVHGIYPDAAGKLERMGIKAYGRVRSDQVPWAPKLEQ